MDGYYVSQAGAQALREYKYSGGDMSFIYTYILTPMNKFLIEFFPMWLAPNVITTISLGFGVLAHLITLYYNPNFDSPMPWWTYPVVCFCLFAYQTLDNLDGRQARRTGTSSPLGLLFDHGCDAINVTMSTLTVAACVCTGPTWYAYHLWFGAMIPFCLATWEEYYTGTLFMGYINGPTDGILSCIGFILLNAFYFPGFFCRTVDDILPASLASISPEWFLRWDGAGILVLVAYVAVVPTAISNFYFVYSHISKTKTVSFVDPLFRLIPFVILMVCATLWRLAVPDLFQAHPRIFFFAVGFLFCNMICKLMVAHLTNGQFSPFRSVLIPLILAVINAYLPAPLISNEICLYVVFVLNVLFWCHFAYYIIIECCEALDIYAFSIKKKENKEEAIPLVRPSNEKEHKEETPLVRRSPMIRGATRKE